MQIHDFPKKKIIARIEDIHTMNYIHCDLKPQNMLMGLGDSADIVRIIDFGLAIQYRDPVTQEHKPILKKSGQKKGEIFVGNSCYASLNCHFGFELSRRDDLESLGYILIDFLKGTLLKCWYFEIHCTVIEVSKVINCARQKIYSLCLCLTFLSSVFQIF